MSHHDGLLWKVRRAAGIALKLAVLLATAKITLQVYIQIRPSITPPAVGAFLHSRLRRRYRGVERTLAPIGLRPGLRILEVGSGTGAYTLPISAAVAPTGSVSSIELQTGMLHQQRRHLQLAGATNVWLAQADAQALPFHCDVFDRAVLIAVLPMVKDKQRVLAEIRRVLRRDGLLIVSEEFLEPEYVPRSVIRRWCRRAGFVELSAWREPWFYTLVFRMTDEKGG